MSSTSIDIVSTEDMFTVCTCKENPLKIIESIRDGINKRKKNDTLTAEKLLKDALKALKRCDPSDLDNEEITEKLDTIHSKKCSFPSELCAINGYVLLDIPHLTHVHPFIISCFIGGANASELGLFEISVGFFELSCQFVEESKHKDEYLKAAARNNLLCAQNMMGASTDVCFDMILKSLMSIDCNDYVYHVLVNNHTRKTNQFTILSWAEIAIKLGILEDEPCGCKSISTLYENGSESCDKEGWSRDKCRKPCKSEYQPREQSSRSRAKKECSDSSDEAKKTGQLHVTGSLQYFLTNELKLVVLKNFLFACITLIEDTYIKEICDIDLDEFDGSPGCANLIKSVKCAKVSYITLDGRTTKTEGEMSQFVDYEAPSMLANFEEKCFRSSDLMFAGEMATALTGIGERNLGKQVVEAAVAACLEKYDLQHPISLYLTKTNEKLFPVSEGPKKTLPPLADPNLLYLNKTNEKLFPVGEVPKVTLPPLTNPPFELESFRISPIFEHHHDADALLLGSGFKAFKHGAPIIHVEIEDLENVHREILDCNMRELENKPLRFLTLATLYGICILTEEKQNISKKEHTKCIHKFIDLSKAAVNTSSLEIQVRPCLTMSISAGLCLLLDAILRTEITTPLSIVDALFESLEPFNNKSPATIPNIEFYKDFNGHISVYLNLEQVSVVGRLTRICNMVTCGNQTSNDDIAARKQPLLKTTELEGRTTVAVLTVQRATSLLDIHELRKISGTFAWIKGIHFVEGVHMICVSSVCPLHLLDMRWFNMKCFKSKVRPEEHNKGVKTQSFFSQEYQRKLTFATKTEPAVLSAALHHHFKLHVLAEEVYKSGTDLTLSFSDPLQALITLSPKGNDLYISLRALHTSPSESDVPQNDIPRICDDVIRKCSDHLEVRPILDVPWYSMKDECTAICFPGNLEKPYTDLETENNVLRTKLQELARKHEEQQEEIASLQIQIERLQSTGTAPEPSYDYPTFQDEEEGPSGYGSVRVEDDDIDLSICSHDNEQTRSLSQEWEIEGPGEDTNDLQHLREIGEADFHRESAERKFSKFITIQQDVQNFKRRREEMQRQKVALPEEGGLQEATGSCNVSKGLPEHEISEENHMLANNLGPFPSDIQESINPSSAKSASDVSSAALRSILEDTSHSIQHNTSDGDLLPTNATSHEIFETLGWAATTPYGFALNARLSLKEDEKSLVQRILSMAEKQYGTTSDKGAIIGSQSERDENLKDVYDPLNTDGESDPRRNDDSIDASILKVDMISDSPLCTRQEALQTPNSVSEASIESFCSAMASFTDECDSSILLEKVKKTNDLETQCIETESADVPHPHSSTKIQREEIVCDSPIPQVTDVGVTDVPSSSPVFPGPGNVNVSENVVCDSADSHSLFPECAYNPEVFSTYNHAKMFCSVPEISWSAKEGQASNKSMAARASRCASEKFSNLTDGRESTSSNTETQSRKDQQIIEGKAGTAEFINENDIGFIALVNNQSSKSEKGKPIPKPRNIFLTAANSQRESEPHGKTILITGPPGIGKTSLLHKVAQEMARDRLLFSNLSATAVTSSSKFPLLMTFRELNLFGRKKCTLRDLMNHFSLPILYSAVDKSMFADLVKFSESIVFFLDGYDEYDHRTDIVGGVLDMEYDDNPWREMPVYVLISKLLRKKFFKDSLVVITSRTTEGQELQEISIDDHFDMEGLSYTQFKDRVESYLVRKPMNEHYLESSSSMGAHTKGFLEDFSLLSSHERAYHGDIEENPFLHNNNKSPLQYSFEKDFLRGHVHRENVVDISNDPYKGSVDSLLEYSNLSLDDATGTTGVSLPFLAKHSIDSGLRHGGGSRIETSDFMSLPLLKNLIKKDSDETLSERSDATFLRTKKQHRHSDIHSLATSGSHGYLDNMEQCNNDKRSSLHISKEIRDKQNEMRSAINQATTLQSLEQYKDAIGYGQRCLDIACDLDDKEMEMRALLNLGASHQNLHKYDQALMFNERCVNLTRLMGNKKTEAIAILNVSSIHNAKGGFQDAMKFSKKCLELSQEIGCRSMEMKSAQIIGNVHRNMGRYQDAIEYYDMSLDLSREVDDKEIEMHVSRDIASIYQSLKQSKNAIKYNKTSFEISKELGDKEMELKTGMDLASQYKNTNLLKSVGYHERCLELTENLGHKQLCLQIAEELAKAYGAMNKPENATKYYKMVFNASKELDDRQMHMETARKLAAVYRNMNNLDNTITYLKQCLNIAKELKDIHVEGEVTSDLADAYKAAKKFHDAIALYNKVLKVSKQQGEKESEMDKAYELADVYKTIKEYDNSLHCYQRCLSLAIEVDDKVKQLHATRDMAKVHEDLNQLDNAIEFYTRSLKIASELGDKRSEMQILQNIAQMYTTRSQFADAIKYHERSLKIVKEEDKETKMQIARDMAIVYHGLKKYDDAMIACKTCLDLTNELDNRVVAMEIYWVLISIHHSLNHKHRAIHFARIYHDIAQTSASKSIDIKLCLVLLSFYKQESQFDEVFIYGKRSVEIAQESNDRHAKILACLAIGEAFVSIPLAQLKQCSVLQEQTLETIHFKLQELVTSINTSLNLTTAIARIPFSERFNVKKVPSIWDIIEYIIHTPQSTTLEEVYQTLINPGISPSDEQQCLDQAQTIWKLVYETTYSSDSVCLSSILPSDQDQARCKHSDSLKNGVSNERSHAKDYSSISCNSSWHFPDDHAIPDSTRPSIKDMETLHDTREERLVSTRNSSGMKDSEEQNTVPSNTNSCESNSCTITNNENSHPLDNEAMRNLPLKISAVKDVDEPVDNGSINSLEVTVKRVRETMSSLMSKSLLGMDVYRRKSIRREREMRRQAEQKAIDDLIEQRKKKALKVDGPSISPVSLPVQVADENLSSCTHFKRGCDMLFPCCNKYYRCHRCHNESTGCEVTDSKALHATHLRCRTCMTEQEITIDGSHCKHCKRKLSEYFCGKCKHYTANDKNPYHCDPCGICRIHKENSFHCDVCNVCLNKRLKGKHKCRPDSGHDECCICLEDAFSGCQVLPCSHKVHRECAVAMIKNGVKTCPICRAPIYQ